MGEGDPDRPLEHNKQDKKFHLKIHQGMRINSISFDINKLQ